MRSSPKVGRASARLSSENPFRPKGGLKPALLLAGLAGFSFLASARAEPAFYAARVAPIFERHCNVCHGAEKQKGKLRLDIFEHALRGAESGAVIKPGDVKGSELFRRITLKPDDEEVMPSDSKPLLSVEEIKIIELWIAAGASATKPLADFPTAPVPKVARAVAPVLAPDWRPRAAEIAALAKATGLKIVPRSQVATDGLVVRTASAPNRCDDAALAKLAPIAPLIVEAELARTKITDAGLKSLASFSNLRWLDLTRTAVSTEGVTAIAGLKHLEALNLTDTAVDDAGVARLKALPTLKRVWLYGSKATETAVAATKPE